MAAAPPAFLFWANCHGGDVMGWAIPGVYWGEAADFLIDHKLTGRLSIRMKVAVT